MGFGWLMVGYFFAFVVSLYSPLAMAMLVGYPLMIIGLRMLAPYHKHLKIAFFSSFASLPFALYFGVDAFAKVGMIQPVFKASLSATMEWVYFVFSFLFTAWLLYALASLCAELTLIRLQTTALRNLLILAFTFLLDLVARLPFGFIQSISMYVGLPLLLLRFIILFLNLYLFFGCYRYICPEGTEDAGLYVLDDLTPKEKNKK